MHRPGVELATFRSRVRHPIHYTTEARSSVSLDGAEAGVCKLLKNLNPGEASGPDEIPTRLLQTLADELTPVVTSLIRQSLSSGQVPKVWKEAWITPVFKKGARSDPANYRPVSLTGIVCKLTEHVLCMHIRSHLDKY